MSIESIDENFDFQNIDLDNVSHSRWNGRDVEYPSRLRDFNCGEVFDPGYPGIHKNFLSHGVRGLRHAGRSVGHFAKKHKKAVIVAAVVAAAVVVVVLTNGAAAPQAVSAIGAATGTPSSGGKRKRDDDEPEGDSPAPSPSAPPPEPTYLPPPPEISGPNWRVPSGSDYTTFPQTHPTTRTTPTLAIDPDGPPRIYSNPPPSNIRFEVPGKPLARGAIGGINGIGNNFEQAETHGKYLSELSGNHQIDWIHNRTHSVPVDIAESIVLNYNGISAPATELKENWTNFHETHLNDPNAKYLQFCHSQGALHVKNALQDAPQEIRDRIIVVAIAPAAVVPKNLCFDSFNYASKRDPIVYGEAAFHYDADAPYEERMAEPSRQALQELILLEPHPDAPLFDHSFDSPTFKRTIDQRIEEYIDKYGGSE